MTHGPVLTTLLLVGVLALAPSCKMTKSHGSSGAGSSGASADSESESVGEHYYAEEYHDGRYYVFGQETTHDAWKGSHHMPYTRTKIGAGPRGETLVFEIDKDWPELTDWLEQKFAYDHWSAEPPFYATVDHDGRTYVIGKKETFEKFRSSPHMPYSRSVIGGRHGGGTVVFEIDKKDPGMTDWLERQYGMRGAVSMPSTSAGGKAMPARRTDVPSSYYSETIKDGRFYVFGHAETYEKFKNGDHMPYTRTKIGGGPAGMTVVIEIDKADEGMVDRLEKEFNRRHGDR